MTLRALIVGPEESAAAEKLAAFAARPENVYRPDFQSAWSPGRDPRYVLHLGLDLDFRVVFSVTDFQGVLYRHLSVSVPATGALPHTAIVESIARLFGFTGALGDWGVGTSALEDCVVVAQRLPST